ncbi:MAG: putative zinc-binding protein [Methanobacteriaceae archaeon]
MKINSSDSKFEDRKIALASCNGMSPYGLITRLANDDLVKKHKNIISICMGATSGDKSGFRELIKKYPIIGINGCNEDCVGKILKQKDVETVDTIDVMEELNKCGLNPKEVARVKKEEEKCNKVIKEKIIELIERL